MSWGTTKDGAKRRINGTKKLGTGVGSKISDEKLIQAAGIWLDLEQKKNSSGKVSALTVGKSLGLSEAPDWLTSSRFREILEVCRFERKVRALMARPEITSTISELVSLGLLEAQKRLVLDPASIPATVLYGDILHKWPKMLHDFNLASDPVQAGDIFQTIVYEINMISNPEVREKMRTSLLGEFNRAALALNSVDSEVVDAQGDDLVRAEPAPVESDPVVNPGGERLTGKIVRGDLSNNPSLWDDPAADNKEN